jgi:hypothetical protein
MRLSGTVLAALLGSVIGGAPLLAQDSGFASRFSLSAVGGALLVDDEGLGFSFEPDGPRVEGRSGVALLVGAVVGFEVVPALALEAHYAHATTSMEADGFLLGGPIPVALEEDRIDVDLWGIRGRLSVPYDGPLRASGVLGYGTIQVDLDFRATSNGGLLGPIGSTARERMWEVGGGVEWRPGSRWSVRADVIDHIQMCSGETHSEVNICGRDGDIDRLHHFAIVGAASLRL